MKTRIFSILIILALSACSTIRIEVGTTPMPTKTETLAPTATPVPTVILTPTITPTPTSTPLQTKTPMPTATPNLTATQVRQATQTAAAAVSQFRKDLASYDIPVGDGQMVLQNQETANLQLTGDQPVFQAVGEDLMLSNFILKIDFSLEVQDGRAGCGLAFRAANDLQKGAQYDFVAKQTAGGPAWAIEYRDHGRLDHYVSGNIRPNDQLTLVSGSVDTLVLVAQGKKISVYANGNLLGSYESGQRGKGKLALAAFPDKGQASCTFSNLSIWALPENGIYGWVTENNQPAGNIKVSLGRWDGKEYKDIASVRSDAYGLYSFENVPALVTGQEYSVMFVNKTDSSRLWSWVTNSISSYELNESVHIGNFDIANVELGLPEDREEISLPYTFTWTPRPNSPQDGYQLYMFDPDDTESGYDSVPVLKYAGEYILNRLPAGFSDGKVYYWAIVIVAKDGSYGYSFASNRIVFQTGESG